MSKGKGRMPLTRAPGFADDYLQAEEKKGLPRAALTPEVVRGDPDRGRRFRLAGGAGQVQRRPHLDALLGSAYTTSWLELERLKKLSEERPLDTDEMRRYVALVDSVAKLSRTEQAAFPDDAEMTKEELLEAAEEARRFLLENGDK